VPEKLKALRELRDKKVTEVLELNAEIAILETHLQVGTGLQELMKREEEREHSTRDAVRPG
jgi:hypothetical protein